MRTYNLNNYHKVSCEEFQKFFKTAPKTYPIVLSDLLIDHSNCYTYGYCTYNTDEILGIFKGANGEERFSEYYILNNT